MSNFTANRLLTGSRLNYKNRNFTANRLLTDIMIRFKAKYIYKYANNAVLLAVLAVNLYKGEKFFIINEFRIFFKKYLLLYVFTANTANTANIASKMVNPTANLLAVLLLTRSTGKRRPTYEPYAMA